MLLLCLSDGYCLDEKYQILKSIRGNLMFTNFADKTAFFLEKLIEKNHDFFLDFQNINDVHQVSCRLYIIISKHEPPLQLSASADFYFHRLKANVKVNVTRKELENHLKISNLSGQLYGKEVVLVSESCYALYAYISSLTLNEECKSLFLEISANCITKCNSNYSFDNISMFRNYCAVMFRASWRLGDFEYEERGRDFTVKMLKVKTRDNSPLRYCLIVFNTSKHLQEIQKNIHVINSLFSFLYRRVSKISEIYVFRQYDEMSRDICCEKVFTAETIKYESLNYNSFSLPALQRVPVFITAKSKNDLNKLFDSWQEFYQKYINHVNYLIDLNNVLCSSENNVPLRQVLLLCSDYIFSLWKDLVSHDKQVNKEKTSNYGENKASHWTFKKIIREASCTCIDKEMDKLFSRIIPPTSDFQFLKNNNTADNFAKIINRMHNLLCNVRNTNNTKNNKLEDYYNNLIPLYNLTMGAYNLLYLSLLYVYFNRDPCNARFWSLQQGVIADIIDNELFSENDFNEIF